MSQPDIARRCPACGVSLRTRAQFCPQCGSSLGAPQASVPQTESPRKQPSPTPDSQAETQGLSPLPRELVSKTQSNKGKNTGYTNKAAPSEYATIASRPSGESGLTTRLAAVADTESKKPAREKRRSKALVESSGDPSLKFLIVTAVIFLVAALLVILSRVIE
jgi:hypothetical protein